MLDFATRRFTRLGRGNKSGLVSGESANKRASVVGRKTSARRVSVRNSSALRRAPSGAGGLHRGTSVRSSQSAVRRGTSVRRAPSAARRNSKRMSAYVDGIPPASSFQPPSTEPATLKPPVSPDTPVQPPPTSKSFFSKLTSRFRGRSKPPKLHIPSSPQLAPESSAIAATFSATNLSPAGFAPPRSPSLRSPSPGSRVTFVDTPFEPAKVPECQTDNSPVPRVDTPPAVEAVKKLPEEADPTPLVEEIVDEGNGSDDEWVDADDDGLDPEPRIPTASNDDSAHAGSTEPAVPEPASEIETSEKIPPPAKSGETARDQPEVVHLQADVLTDLAQGSIGVDVRVSQWLADTPVVVVDGESKSEGDGRVKSLEGIVDGGEAQVEAAALSKVEVRKRPPRIIVPDSLSSNNPFRVSLPPSPSPSSTLPETNPFRSLITAESSLAVEASSPESLIPPPSPSIFLTPAGQHDEFDLDLLRECEELLAVDSTQVPLPPSPSPSHASLASPVDDPPVSPSSPNVATVTRNGSVSTSGGRSLSTTPSTRGPATPTSIRIPGHPAFAHFSFGGPHSPSLKVEDWEEGEEDRGRSLEVGSGKRRMRSTSPGLDAVLEGDESRRSRASIEELERKGSPEPKQPLSPLPIVEHATTFGQKRGDDTESEHEDEDGFFAFAEHRLVEEERKAAETRQLEVPKRSKTMSFLGVGFGKRKSTVGDPRPMSPAMTRSATSGGLLSLPTPAPKRSSTLEVSPNRLSRLMPGQRSSTMMPLAEPRVALSPTMYSIGDIHTETGKIEDDESRRLSEAVFMF
ncbi:hypothetical protein FRC10_008649 [Ceratobasidium sp. 414]|nr:hypothetical protein FRC10_008649 [Ceratobasidium sp. 414]